MAKSATAAKQDAGGMDKGELKRVLRMAQHEPVHVAFAIGGDGKAILVADKRKPPRALEKQLKEEAADSKNHRFGTASVDPDDPKLVRFTVNKAANGMARKLTVALKGTGFSHVEIGSEDGAPAESAHDEEEQAATGHGALPAVQDGAAKPQAAQAAGQAGKAAAGAAAGAAAPGADAPKGGSIPKFEPDTGHTPAMLAKLDEWQNQKVEYVLQNGKPEKVADLVKRQADHLTKGANATRKIAKGIVKDVDDMSGVWAKLSGKQHFVDDARKHLAAVDQALAEVDKALGGGKPNLARAHASLQDVFHQMQQALDEVGHYYGKAADQWGAAARVSVGVRNACTTTMSVLATPLGPVAVGAVGVFTKALEEVDNVAQGEPLHLGKDAAEIILDVTILKFAKPIGQAIERPVGAWVAKNLGPRLATAADSVLVKQFEEWAAKNVPQRLAPRSAEWLKAFHAFLEKENLEKKIVEKMKDLVLENSKKILVGVADRASHKHEEGKPIKERCIEFLKELQEGHWVQEKGSEKLMEALLHKAVERAAGH